MTPLLVVAGNYAEARRFADDRCLLSEEWRFVHDFQDLRGRRGSRVVFVGTWIDRPMVWHLRADVIVAGLSIACPGTAGTEEVHVIRGRRFDPPLRRPAACGLRVDHPGECQP